MNSVDKHRPLLTLDNTKRKGFEALSLILEENATVILDSCSTGREKGIMQTISRKLNTKVILQTQIQP